MKMNLNKTRLIFLFYLLLVAGGNVKTYAEFSDIFNTEPNGRFFESIQIAQLEAKIAGNELKIKNPRSKLRGI
jgi:hypothetical protein